MKKVKDLPESERPREKGLRYGVEALSNRELLAILIRCGTRGKSALDLADDLLETSGGLKGLGPMPAEKIAGIPGFSKVKALELKAALELPKRIAYEDVLNADVIHSPEVLYRWLSRKQTGKLQEEFIVIFLDSGLHVMSAETLFIGTSNRSLVSTKEILKNALDKGASSIILAHNHPGGTADPSDEDIAITQKIMYAARLADIEVLDHLIIAEGRCVSMKREGLLP